MAIRYTLSELFLMVALFGIGLGGLGSIFIPVVPPCDEATCYSIEFISIILICTGIFLLFGRWKLGVAFGVMIGSTAGVERRQVTWVGHTNLTLTMVVCDVTTGIPIPNAVIEVNPDADVPGRKQRLYLSSDGDGVVSQAFPETMCSGTTSRFIDTYSVSAPPWLVRAAAVGYRPSDWLCLPDSEAVRRVKRIKPGEAEVILRFALTPE